MKSGSWVKINRRSKKPESREVMSLCDSLCLARELVAVAVSVEDLENMISKNNQFDE